MTNSDRDQELLQKYMAHLLPEDDERLKQIKQHVGSEIFRSRQKSTLKKREPFLYGFYYKRTFVPGNIWWISVLTSKPAIWIARYFECIWTKPPKQDSKS